MLIESFVFLSHRKKFSIDFGKKKKTKPVERFVMRKWNACIPIRLFSFIFINTLSKLDYEEFQWIVSMVFIIESIAIAVANTMMEKSMPIVYIVNVVKNSYAAKIYIIHYYYSAFLDKKNSNIYYTCYTSYLLQIPLPIHTQTHTHNDNIHVNVRFRHCFYWNVYASKHVYIGHVTFFSFILLAPYAIVLSGDGVYQMLLVFVLFCFTIHFIWIYPFVAFHSLIESLKH